MDEREEREEQEGRRQTQEFEGEAKECLIASNMKKAISRKVEKKRRVGFNDSIGSKGGGGEGAQVTSMGQKSDTSSARCNVVEL